MASQLSLLKAQQRRARTSKRIVAPISQQQSFLRGEKTSTQQIISSNETEIRKQEELKKKVETTQGKLSGLSYEDYFKEYEKLPSDVKQYFTSPSEIKQSSEYKSYQQQKTQYESQLATYQSAQHQAALYRKAYELIARGKVFAASGDKELMSVINKIYAYKTAAAEDLLHYSSVSAPIGVVMTEQGGVSTAFPEQYVSSSTPSISTISFDKLGQGVSSASPIPSVFQPQTTKDIFTPKTTQLSVSTVNQETQRYQDLGYSKSEAKAIAKESIKQGGMSFAPETSERIIKGETYSQIEKSKEVSKGFDMGDITGGASDIGGRGSAFSFITGATTESQGLKDDVTFEGYGKSDVLSGVSLGVVERDNIFTRARSDYLVGKEKGKEQRKEFYEQPFISAFDQREFSESMKMSSWQGFKLTGRNIFQSAFGSREWGGEFDPLIYQTGKLKADEEVYIQNGKIIDAEHLSKLQKKQLEKLGHKIITREQATERIIKKDKEISEVKDIVLDYQNERAGYDALSEKISNKLAKKYQEKIDTGKLSYDVAVEQYQTEFKEEYKEQAKKLEKAYGKYGGLYERRGDVGKVSRFGTELALMSNPLTASILGAGKIKAGEKKDILEMESGMPLYPSFQASEKTREGQFIISTLALHPLGKIKRIEKSIVADELLTLSKQPINYESLLYKGTGKEGDIIVTKAIQRSGKLQTEIDIIGKVMKEGDKKFIMPLGTAEARTTGELSWNIMGGKEPTKVLGISESLIGGRSVMLSHSNKISKFLSREVLQPQMQMGAFTQGIGKPSPYVRFPSPRIRYGTKATEEDVNLILKQFRKTLKTGGTTTINIQPSTSVKLTDDLYFGFTPKGDKGFTKIVKGDEGVLRIIKESDEVSRVVEGKFYTGGVRRGVEFPTGRIIEKPLEPLDISKIKSARKTSFAKTFTEEKPSLNALDIQKRAIQKEVEKQIVPPSVSENILKEISKKQSEVFLPLLKKSSDLSKIIAPVSKEVFDLSKSRFSQKESQKLTQKFTSKQVQEINEAISGALAISQVSDETLVSKESQILKSPPALTQPQMTKQINDVVEEFTFSPTQISTQIQPPIPPVKPVTLPPFLFFFGRKEIPETKKHPSTEEGYRAEVYKDATKKAKAKWIPINKQPLVKEEAKDLAFYTADHSISARVRLKKARGKPKKLQEQFNIPIGYAKQTEYKFRDYRIIKGKRSPMKNTFIEKRSKRLDTQGEVQKIQAERLIAQRRRINPIDVLMPLPQQKTKKKIQRKKKQEINWNKILGF
ncbi:MAG TPA: hypothetical protein VMV95_00205 [Bacillota bacterium]|nr:hypothetical protein [Bacillota bacterium]